MSGEPWQLQLVKRSLKKKEKLKFLELLLNFLYIKLYRPKNPIGLRDGHIRPTTSNEFNSRKKAFRMYSYIYPFVWIITRLDYIFFFQRGCGLLVWAKKN